MSYIKIRPTKSYLNLENTGTSDMHVQRIVTNNAQPGQLLVLDKYNRRDVDASEGRVYLISDVNPNPESSDAGNIRIPKTLDMSTIANNGYDEIEIKYEIDTSGELNKITKTVVKLMFDGEMWNVLSVVDNVHWET